MGSRNAFGAFIEPMEDEFGWSRGLISLAAAVAMLANGFFQPFVGWLYDKHGGRRVIMSGLVVVGLTTILLSQTNNIIFFIMVYGVIASIGHAGGSINTTSALLTRWFRRRRATALGLATLGMSVGGLVMVPLAVYLIAATDWRTTWIVIGAIILGLGLPISHFLLRNDPKDMGLLPDGDTKPHTGSAPVAPRETRGPLEVENWREAFRSPPFWQMSGAYFVCGATTAVMSVHFIPNATDNGMERSTAALAFGLMMVLNVVGVLVATHMADKFPRKNLLGIVYAGRGLGYIILLLAPAPWSIWGFASIVGFTWIATAPLTTTLAADVYGLKYLGTLSGMIFLGHQIGAAISIQFAGVMHDITGNYDIPFAIVGSLLFLASLSAFSIKEKKYSSKYQTRTTAPGTTPSFAGQPAAPD